MENGQATHESRGPSRRDLIKGAAVAGVAAWTAPVIIDSLGSPAAAESLPPCHPQFTDSAVNWVVDGASYPGCSGHNNSHRDVVMHFDVGACAEAVKVRVTPVSGKAMWCAWANNYSYVEKTVPANTTGALNFPSVGESLPGGCTAVVHTNNAVDDGIHVNPCATNQIMWEYWIGATHYGPFYYQPPLP